MRFQAKISRPLTRWSIGVIAVMVGLLVQWQPSLALDRGIDFESQILPILQTNCFECHAGKAARSGLHLNLKIGMTRGGNFGPAVVPGKPEESGIFHRLRGDKGLIRMPLGKPPLPQEQIDRITQWINEGAKVPPKYEGTLADILHWAYVAPVRPAPPTVKDVKWIRNPIDHFVLSKLEGEGMSPAPEADRVTLVRRLYLDLIGLPPTPAQADAFVNDSSPDAYEKLVDQLLASPHYGERWARPWLDLARYADSQGYEKDRMRTMWPYRDWVIKALNADMPFDQFTTEQLAGDLLPNATLDQQIASGFNRNSMINEEGGVDPDESFYNNTIERTNVTTTLWLGSTMNCAQCHNHKFDPFSMRDYYRMYAFFNTAAAEQKQGAGSENRDISPTVSVSKYDIDQVKKNIASAKDKLTAKSKEIAPEMAAWEAAMKLSPPWKPATITDVSAMSATLKSTEAGVLDVTGPCPPKETYTVVLHSPTKRITAIRLDAMLGSDGKGPGRSENGNFVLSEIQLSRLDTKKPTPVAFAYATAAFEQSEYSVDLAIDGKVDSPQGGAVGPEVGKPSYAIFQLAQPLELPDDASLQIKLTQNYGSAHTLTRFKISVIDSDQPIVAPGAAMAKILDTPADKRSAEDSAKLVDYYARFSPTLQPLHAELAENQAKLAANVKMYVMRESETPRESFMHTRGAYLSPDEKVTPGTPRMLPPMKSDLPANRLGLAKWLMDPENPLVSRVMVNRLWEWHFGTGIVQTSEDLGTQCTPPTHPELLDYLATEFIQQKWSMKAMHRLIVTSATYRQSSRVTPDELDKDPRNRLLERGPRFRLDGEFIRDQSLAVSGLLSEKMFGPSVMPYQPDGLWNTPYSGERWTTSEGEDRFRRGVYTFWKRAAPYPTFLTFDAPSRESMCTRRPRTNTALQALNLLNDPAFMQPAAALARRLAKEGGPTIESRINFAFRQVLVRAPKKAEVDRLSELYTQQLANYKADADAARKVADSGLGAAEGDPVDLAAWTMVCNVLLNLDETINRG